VFGQKGFPVRNDTMAPRTEKRYTIWVVYRFLGHKMTSNEKSLNYKVIDLVESYNFYINFIFIRVHTKNYDFLKELNPTAYHTAFADATLPAPANAVPHSSWNTVAPPTAV
jgi:hypothetical protein